MGKYSRLAGTKPLQWIGKKINSAGALQLLNWMPDEMYLKCIYWFRMKKKLNLNNPTLYSEKMQWLKIYNRKDIFTKLVDKYEVKNIIADTIGKQYIIPTLGVWDSFEEISFDNLPEQFVLKCTHDSGGLIICRDKKKFDFDHAKGVINKCLKANFYWSSREWPYKNVKPRVIAEQYMEEESGSGEIGLTDYKFFCFNGTPKLLYVSRGLENHSTARISFYDLNGKEMYYHRSDYKPLGSIVLPDQFEKMIEIAKILSERIDTPFIRIDLYSIKNRIYFSEITFFPCSGMIPFEPIGADEELGSMLILN